MEKILEEKELNKRIGANIKKYRYKYNIEKEPLNQKELAKRVGVSTSAIGMLESKKSSQGISVFNLYKISKVLETPIDKFLE